MKIELAFAGLLLVTGVSRVVELAISRRNLAVLRAHAAREGGVVRACESRGAFAVMVVLHLLLLLAPALENSSLQRVTPGFVFAVALVIWSLGQILRWLSIRALGMSWNVHGAVSTVQPVIQSGLYRWIRHPNYLGVLLEAIAIPLAGSAWLSLALLVPVAAVVTWRRLRAEERLLAELPEWRDAFLH